MDLSGTEQKTDPLVPDGSSSKCISNVSASETIQHDQGIYETNESSSTLQLPPKPYKSWFRRNFPTMTILLDSPRIRVAVYGCFTHTTFISSFDVVLPLCEANIPVHVHRCRTGLPRRHYPFDTRCRYWRTVRPPWDACCDITRFRTDDSFSGIDGTHHRRQLDDSCLAQITQIKSLARCN